MPKPRSSARYASFTVVLFPARWQILRSLRLPQNDTRAVLHSTVLALGELSFSVSSLFFAYTDVLPAPGPPNRVDHLGVEIFPNLFQRLQFLFVRADEVVGFTNVRGEII